MRRIVIASFIAATANLAVAANPYQPFPDSRKQSGNSGTSYSSSSNSNQVPATTYGSGVKTYGIGGTADDFSYKPATSDGRVSGATGSAAAPATNWDTYSQIQQMQQEIQTLRGQVEQLTHDMEMMQKQSRERYLDLDSRINQVRGGAAAPVATPDDQPVSADAVTDDKVLYDQASALRREQKFPESIAVMEDLLKRSPSGMYAPYCEYWLGEMYMVVNPPDMERAKRHFITLIGNYSDHVKVPDAMYKLGKLFATQGEKAKAKATLNELIKQHPDKSAANLAKDLLKTL